MHPGFARMTEEDSGFTIVEIIVAATILFIASVSLLSMILAGQQWAIRAQERENLVNFTAGYMERIRGLSYAEIGTVTSSDPTGTIPASIESTVGAYTVRVEPTIVWVEDHDVPGVRYKLVTLAGTARLTETGASVMTNTLESIVSSAGVR